MTWPQNVGNRISEDLNFKIFRGRMPPDPPIEPPSLKSWIRPRNMNSSVNIFIQPFVKRAICACTSFCEGAHCYPCLPTRKQLSEYLPEYRLPQQIYRRLTTNAMPWSASSDKDFGLRKIYWRSTSARE